MFDFFEPGTIANYLSILGLLVALYSLFYQLRRQSKKKSAELAIPFDDKEFAKSAMVLMGSCRRNETELRRIGLPVNGQSDEAYAIREILNSWEAVAIGCNHGIYDDSVLFFNYSSLVQHVFLCLWPFIEERQKCRRRLYCEFSVLALLWSIRSMKIEKKSLEIKILILRSLVVFSKLSAIGGVVWCSNPGFRLGLNLHKHKRVNRGIHRNRVRLVSQLIYLENKSFFGKIFLYIFR